MARKSILVLFLLVIATTTVSAAVDSYVTLNSASEDYIDFGPLDGFNTNSSWALVEQVKIPRSIKSGYQLARGLAWQDKSGDFLITVGPGGMSAWLYSGGWRKIDVPKNIADDQWHNICFQFRAELRRTELWLDGKMIGSNGSVSPPDSSSNENHFVIGGQLAAPDKRQGKLYLELSSSISHLALLQRALAAEEIAAYQGAISLTTRGLYLSTAISSKGIKDARTNNRTTTINGKPMFVGGTSGTTLSCKLCAATPGFISRNVMVREMVPCPACEGKGQSQCRMCKGEGKLRTGRSCRSCKGTGNKKCIRCRGKGGRERMVRQVKRIPCPRCGERAQTEETNESTETTKPEGNVVSEPPKPAGPSAIELAKRALALLNAGKIGESIKLYEQAVALAPRNHVIHHDLGIACFKAAQKGKRDKLDVAEKHFRQALALKSDYFKAHESLGAVLGTKGRYDEAIASLLRAHELAPKNAGICRNIAYTYHVKYKKTKNKADFAQERKWRALAAKLR